MSKIYGSDNEFEYYADEPPEQKYEPLISRKLIMLFFVMLLALLVVLVWPQSPTAQPVLDPFPVIIEGGNCTYGTYDGINWRKVYCYEGNSSVLWVPYPIIGNTTFYLYYGNGTIDVGNETWLDGYNIRRKMEINW
ncbi:hypothetical protein [Candidatus Magnetobacterium casense]|uniref:Secreted protein n=1 Tax=Candidatus Magnetobacterium casense TaxID=1455061 RepID=A0ABS6RXX7_9BACT|nr:hypothetical protein [Candidatus Magnetobacterium casensis]MBV6341476.1 hypothetical protein [Candidatus Magnetobacterium casensis]